MFSEYVVKGCWCEPCLFCCLCRRVDQPGHVLWADAEEVLARVVRGGGGLLLWRRQWEQQRRLPNRPTGLWPLLQDWHAGRQRRRQQFGRTHALAHTRLRPFALWLGCGDRIWQRRSSQGGLDARPGSLTWRRSWLAYRLRLTGGRKSSFDKPGPDSSSFSQERPLQLLHPSTLYETPSWWTDWVLICRAYKVNLIHASAQFVPSCDCQNCHQDSFSLPYSSRPKTQKQVLWKVSAEEPLKSVKITGGMLLARQVALHLLWNDATNHHSATCLYTHSHQKQVEIDHVAKRNSCCVSALYHPPADDGTQMTPSGGPHSRLIPCVISSMLLYVKRVYIQTWRTVSIRPQLYVLLVTWNGNGKKRWADLCLFHCIIIIISSRLGIICWRSLVLLTVLHIFDR